MEGEVLQQCYGIYDLREAKMTSTEKDKNRDSSASVCSAKTVTVAYGWSSTNRLLRPAAPVAYRTISQCWRKSAESG
ncbi:hypothetical protein M514_23384 [Trichuris suis]|uniref:Uncharacterized protein n=1 Tax=Trichuris suis TaxID=68888 RepID=A0A085N4G4_9BILA|nr:hypothetical protein M514_23384 [Trichuris suis]